MKKFRILVVDDEDVTLRLLERILVDARYSVCTANCGQEAVAKAKAERPDLILMDIVLPDINGAEAAQEIHQNPKLQDIPILFISGIAKKNTPDTGEPVQIKAGSRFYDIIAKPFESDELLRHVRKTLALS